MARKPRSIILFDNCTTHKVWRAHNKENYLAKGEVKEFYISSFNKTLDRFEKKNKPKPALQAICIMSNHVHEIFRINELKDFSGMMRIHHSRFGQWYNYKNKRCGKVAQARPHTTCFENNSESMDAVLYVHANPFKAGMIKDDKAYPWSSHSYYAWGTKPKLLKNVYIELPEWYLKLGKTAKERQSAYRKLFNDYMRKIKSNKGVRSYSDILFVGSQSFELEKNNEIRVYLHNLYIRNKDSP